MNVPVLFATVAVLAVIFAAGYLTHRYRWWRRERLAFQRGWDAGRHWEQLVRRETWDLYGVVNPAFDDDGDTDEILALPAHTDGR